jgi:4-amino-4-deoxy-L-arabinose transferase-like glycosyltransferase
MARSLRHLFRFLAALSTLLFIATLILWFRSHRFTETASWRNANGSKSIHSASGYVVIDVLNADWSPNPTYFQPLQYDRDIIRPPFNYFRLLGGSAGDIDSHWERAGFGWHEKRNAGRQTLLVMLVIPFWAVSLLSCLLPGAYIGLRLRTRIRRRRMERLGLCTSCGYDLRGTPMGNPCPECGGLGSRNAIPTIPI